MIRMKEQNPNRFTVKQNPAAYGVAVFIFASAVAIFILEMRYHIKEIPAWIYFVIGGIFLLGIYVWAEACNRRLVVEEDTFYYRSVLGKMVSFSKEEIGVGKAAYHASKGRDYLRLYDKGGKTLCRLECSMKNAPRLIWYLHDNGVPIGLEAGAEGYAGDIIRQHYLTEDMLPEQSRQVFAQMQELAEKWQERNRELGAELEYGFACYYSEKMKEKVQGQPGESHFVKETAKEAEKKEEKEAEEAEKKEEKTEKDSHSLPDDYLCRMELYVKKDGCLVQDRRGRRLMLEAVVFYKRKSDGQEAGYRLYHNSVWTEEMGEAMERLESYLPRHRFVLAQEPLEYPLEKSL